MNGTVAVALITSVSTLTAAGLTGVVSAARHRPLPGWTRRLASGDRALLGGVADAARHFHTRLILPDWSEVEATVAADREGHLDALDGGLPAVLGTLEPFVWRDSVLTAPYPVDHDLRLHGRGRHLLGR
ncbi:hypothetical protein [Streptomyces sp. RKND-216]|uniref:hypothetical protein n=1 Tax=Streptomyces sp. RKND-216 TaxID=2562581 RepID=UPI001FFBD73B|nr:hypothetical protein [Streptomyces sp. RKND-216]